MKSPTWTLEYDYVENAAFFDNVFTPKECAMICEIAKEYEVESGSLVGASETSIRDSGVSFLEPNEKMSWVYYKLTDAIKEINEEFFKFDLFSIGENLQFTTYALNQHYNYHIDKIHNGPIRKLSIVLQLTDPSKYEGGDLEVFYGGEAQKLPRAQGTLIAFPSYVVHRVTPVTSGVRNSLVGWINGNPFK